MLTEESQMEIQVYRKQGKSLKWISKQMGLSRNTVRKYLREAEIKSEECKRRRPSKLDPYKDYIQTRIETADPIWIPSTVVYREIKEKGFQGKERIVRSYLARLKPKEETKPVIRYETAPGIQMQMDWAVFRRGKDRLSAFVATLGYSRYSYVEFVDNEKIDTLIRCHENAMVYMGGVPKVILYDNAKTVVIQRNAYGEGLHRFHPQLLDIAKHYGFIPKLCQPYRPQTKGKVERFIRYLKHSFYYPLQTLSTQNLDVATVNAEVLKWLRDIANVRIHQTTGDKPATRLEDDRKQLLVLPPNYSGQSVRVASDTSGKQQPSIQHSLSVYEAMLQEMSS